MADWNGFKKNGTTYTPNDSTARGWIGTLSNLATTVKTNIVAAINELVTGIASRVDWSSYAKTGVHQWFDKYTKQMTEVNYEVLSTGLRFYNTSPSTWYNLRPRMANLKKNTDYVFSCDVSIVSGTVTVAVVGYTSEDVTLAQDLEISSGDHVELSFNTGNYTYIDLKIFGTRETSTTCDVSLTNMLVKLASDTDSSYADYAMTNEELTEAVKGWKEATIGTPSSGSLVSANSKVMYNDDLKLLSIVLQINGNDADASINIGKSIGTNNNALIGIDANDNTPTVCLLSGGLLTIKKACTVFRLCQLVRIGD